MTFKDYDLTGLRDRMKQLDGAVVKVGIQEGSAHLDKAIWNNDGTSDGRIPPRAFVSDFADVHAGKLKGLAEKAIRPVIVQKKSPRAQLDQFGEKAADLMRDDVIDGGRFEANAPSTVAQKGFDSPLIESGAMAFDIDHKLEGI